MRMFLVAAALALASCASGPPHPMGTGYDPNGFKLTCDKCGSQALCVGAPYVPVCLQQCRTTADCDAGLCSIIGNDPAGERVCAGGLMLCEPTTCNNPPMCLADGVTQLKPLTGSICGWQLITCDKGCDAATGSCK